MNTIRIVLICSLWLIAYFLGICTVLVYQYLKQPRIKAKGKQLDALAAACGVARKRFETDRGVRKRIMAFIDLHQSGKVFKKSGKAKKK